MIFVQKNSSHFDKKFGKHSNFGNLDKNNFQNLNFFNLKSLKKHYYDHFSYIKQMIESRLNDISFDAIKGLYMTTPKV
jgi:hypothetical protein